MVINAIDPMLRQNTLATPGKALVHTDSSAFQAALQRAESTANVHTVQRGDTLSHIVSSQLRATGGDTSKKAIYDAVQQVARANGLKNPDRLSLGQEIDLSSLTKTTTAASTSPLGKAATGYPEDILMAEAIFEQARFDAASQRADAVIRQLKSSAASKSTDYKTAPVEDDGLVTAVRANPWAPLIGKPSSLTSDFGMRSDPFTGRPDQHNGIDLASKSGAAIHPYAPGKVAYSGWQRGYGNVVIVDHGDGLETVYGHNQKNLVKKGELVDEETRIGKVGSTGAATGPHLHFEVRKDGVAVDPKPFLEERDVILASAT